MLGSIRAKILFMSLHWKLFSCYVKQIKINKKIMGSSLMVLAPIYNHSNDIYRVIEYNDPKRPSVPISGSVKITHQLVKNEIKMFLVNGIRSNDISKLEFISNSELDQDADWDHYMLINEAIKQGNVKILEFILRKRTILMDWWDYVNNVLKKEIKYSWEPRITCENPLIECIKKSKVEMIHLWSNY
jgi:hypothetical protein